MARGESFLKDVEHFKTLKEEWSWLSVASSKAIGLVQQLSEDARPLKRKAVTIDNEPETVESFEPVAKRAKITARSAVEDSIQDVLDEDARIADEIKRIDRRVATMIADYKALDAAEDASPTSMPAREPD